MLTTDQMARAIADTEGKYLEKAFRELLYESMLKLGREAPLHLEGRYEALSIPKDKLHQILSHEKFQR